LPLGARVAARVNPTAPPPMMQRSKGYGSEGKAVMSKIGIITTCLLAGRVLQPSKKYESRLRIFMRATLGLLLAKILF
jgi:hypothetical protein